MKEKKVMIAIDLALKPTLPSYTIYSPILSLPPSLTLYELPPPPSVLQVSAIHVFLVNILLLFLSLLLYFHLIFIIWALPK